MKPYEIEIEPSLGCNRKCDFCGNFTFDYKAHGMMSLDTCVTIAQQIRNFGKLRVTLAGRGEPTLNPEFFEMVALIRFFCPEVQISLITNAAKNVTAISKKFWAAGGNYVLLDDYDNVSGINRTEAKVNPWQFTSNKKTGVINLDNPYNPVKLARQFTTRCGAVNPRVHKKWGMQAVISPLQKKCDKPFRRILIRHNGDLGLCCMDWRGELRLGNVNEIESLHTWWEHSVQLKDIRKNLLKRNRNFKPCNVCDFAGGHRLGFLHMEDFAHGA